MHIGFVIIFISSCYKFFQFLIKLEIIILLIIFRKYINYI